MMIEIKTLPSFTTFRPLTDFSHWLKHGKQGSSFVYCVGELAKECEEKPKSDLVKIRQIAIEACRAKMLCLIQRPRGHIGSSKRIRSFDYIAVKR